MLLMSWVGACGRSVRPRAFRRAGMVLLGLGWAMALPSPAPAQTPLNPDIEVGVVQRFGEELTDVLVLKAPPGDQLTIAFETNGQAQSLSTTEARIALGRLTLPQPELEERVVLSTHRSFESAEDSANQWRQRGIAVEIAQPDTWQVWADRSTYGTPMVRRLLLKNLAAQGFDTPFLDSQVVAQVHKSAFIANGYRYNRDRFKITSGTGQISVSQEGSPTRTYAGPLRLQPNAYGTYTLVNDVPIETYLRGVVPHEIGLGAPPTAIEAQAVLARTYALRNLRRFEIDDYELCADTHCQVYWGLGGAAPQSDRAIAATRGLVLTYQDELIDALYSSTTGGVTSPFSHVWNGPDRPYLRAVVDSVQNSWDLALRPLNDEQNFRAFIALDKGFNEDDWDTFRWQIDSPLAEVTQDVRTYLQRQQDPKASFSRVLDVQVTERAPSGRVQEVTVQTDLGPVQLQKDEVIRVLSAPRSLLFYIDPILQAPAQAKADNAATPEGNGSADNPAVAQTPPEPQLTGYRFVGGGRGHGVGMSQTGAYRLGKLGWSSADILRFYYPGTALQPITDDLVYWRDPAEAQATNPQVTNP